MDAEAPSKGRRDELILALGDVAEYEIDPFLDVMHARQAEQPLQLTIPEWGSAVRLARRWGFDALYDLAIRRIVAQYPEHDAVDRVELSINCGVAEWLHPAFNELVTRESPITAQEGERLGHLRTAALWRIREAYRSAPHHDRCGRCVACSSGREVKPPCLDCDAKDAMKWIWECRELQVPEGGALVEGGDRGSSPAQPENPSQGKLDDPFEAEGAESSDQDSPKTALPPYSEKALNERVEPVGQPKELTRAEKKALRKEREDKKKIERNPRKLQVAAF